MLKLIFLIFCFILQSAAANPSTNTENDSHHHHKHLHRSHLLTEIDPKSIAGTPVAITTAPWQVSVRLKSYEKMQYGYGHICGGAVIARRVVVSAAHCALRNDVTPATHRNPSEFKLVMGSVYLYEITPFTLEFDVLHIVPHNDFKHETLQNDLALYFLDGLIPENHPTVAPIPLTQVALDSNTNCMVTGWGITEKGTNWPVLLGAVVPLVESAHCNSSYGGNITRGMLCAGHTSAGDMDACQGDSGGPLACNKILVGIVSWGKGCVEHGSPGVYTKIAEYRNWINLTSNSTRYNAAAGLLADRRQLVWALLGVFVSLTCLKGA